MNSNRTTQHSVTRSERAGLVMVAASLLVIAAITWLLLYQQQAERLTQVRGQGVNLARMLSELPYGQLVPQDGRHGPLALIGSSQNHPDFAYGAVTDTQGRTIAQTTASGVILPHAEMHNDPTSWFGEHILVAGNTGRTFREFDAPLLQDGELVGHVRVGYLEPGYAPSLAKLPFFAMLALPVFLLTPIFYLLLKRETAPLHQANMHIQEMLSDRPIQRVELEATGEVADFMRNFNRLLETARDKVRELESQQTGMVTSNKVLSYRKARVESVLQSLPNGIVVLDENTTVTYANDKLTSMTTVDPATIVGRKPLEWCQSDELLGFLNNATSHSAKHGVPRSIEFATRLGSSEKHLRVQAYPLFSPSEDGTIFGTLVVLQDISAETLARQARSGFVAHLSHELKTPLQSMGMYGELLRGEDGASEEFRIEAANVICDQVERLNALISNMLNITQIEMGSATLNRTVSRPGDLLQDVFDTVAPIARDAGVTVELALPPGISHVNIDKDQMRVALNNLATNAVKYSDRGDTVWLGAEESDEHFRLFVKDTGIGIREDDQARIFDKFFRAEDASATQRPGQGLGLALSRQIVELHSGELRVESVHGEGSEFSIVLHKTPVLLKEAV